MTETFTDNEIVEKIKLGGRNADTALGYLIKKYRASIIALLTSKSVTSPEDIFQDTIYAAFIQIEKGNFKGQSNLKTYLRSIAINLANSDIRKKIKDRNKVQEANEEDPNIKIPEFIFEINERAKYLKSILSKLGENCREILVLWSEGYTMDDIASATGYKNANSAKKRKSLCMKQLMKLIQTLNLSI